ncbi:hypothetical protein O6H91_Y185100 [Diphasiastrum complanatum]|nr:hypothetical protein O6H91_Y185100 [Diphasiastrum complanatum]
MAIDDVGQSSNNVGVKDDIESSTTTMEIKIKMLDSSTHTICVNKDLAIPTLKEQLALVLGVPAQQQRLIFRGKVLKDDQLLSSYNVEDGDSLHLVVRQIVEPGAVNSEGVTTSQESQDGASMPARARPTQVTHSVVLGTINITNAGEGGLPDLNRIVSAVLNSVGSGNTSFESAVNGGVTTGVLAPNVHATAPNTSTRPEVANGGQPPQMAANNLPTQMSMEVVPDALETLSLFLNRVHENFMANGFVREGTSHASPDLGTFQLPSASHAGNIGQAFPSATSAATPRQSLTPGALGNIIRHVQGVLTNQAEAAFSRLSGQLENETTLTDVVARGEVQSAAIWTGNMMQQLGALLMELGRTTLTLRMGQSPAEAVVNSGPAVFISPIGPNPIMPLPFQTGFPFGDFRVQVPQAMPGMTRPPSFNAVGPRGVNIQIHARDLGSVLASGALPPNMQLPSQILAGLASGASAQRPEQAQTGQAENAEQSPPGPETASGPNLQVLPGVVQGAIMIIQENGTSRVVPIMPRAAPLSNNIVPPIGAETRPNSGGFTPINARFQQQMDPLLTQLRPLQLGTFYNQATNSISSQDPVPNSGQQQSATTTESARPLGITITVPLHLTPQLAEPQPQQIVPSAPGIEPVSRTTEISINSTETPGVISNQTEIVEGTGSYTSQNQQSVNISSANAVECHINAESATNSNEALDERSESSSDGLQNNTREQIETALEENDSKCKGLQSDGVDVIPAGLGLGSLPPLPLKPSRRSKAKHRELSEAEQTKAKSSAPLTEEQDLAVNSGRRFDDSKVQSFQRGKSSARVEEHSTSETSSKDILQGMFSLLDNSAKDGQIHSSSSGTEQLVSNSVPSNVLHRGANRDGQQSPIPSDAFGSMMGQLMRSPIMGSLVSQVAQSMGEAQNSPTDPENAQIGDMLGGLDIASMLQQTLPLISQLFRSASPVGQSDQSSLRAFGEVEPDHRQHPRLESSRATTGESSQVKLEETAEKVQNGERPEDIFRSVAEHAAKYVLSSSSSDEIADLAGALVQTTGLADAYMSLLCHDLARRLATEEHQNEVSQSPHATQRAGRSRPSEQTEEKAKRF